jgi:hypothetical protein
LKAPDVPGLRGMGHVSSEVTMYNTQDVIKNLSENDPVEQLVEKLVGVCPKGKGRNFSARFIAIKGCEFWFENKRGMRWMINRDDIRTIYEMPARSS